MGHTGVSVRDRTVTKTCIKLPVVTAWDISSDSPLHWIPCHSSLNGQTDEFMHNWDLYYEKENEGSVFSLAVSGGMKEAGRDRRGEGKREAASLPPRSRGREGREEGRGLGGNEGVIWGGGVKTAGARRSLSGSPHRAQLHTEPPRYLHRGGPAMSSGDCKWINPSGLLGKLIYSLSCRSDSCEDDGKGLWWRKTALSLLFQCNQLIPHYQALDQL